MTVANPNLVHFFNGPYSIVRNMFHFYHPMIRNEADSSLENRFPSHIETLFMEDWYAIVTDSDDQIAEPSDIIMRKNGAELLHPTLGTSLNKITFSAGEINSTANNNPEKIKLGGKLLQPKPGGGTEQFKLEVADDLSYTVDSGDALNGTDRYRLLVFSWGTWLRAN
jgi:hypothetical protein